jgi:hypothetical protein
MLGSYPVRRSENHGATMVAAGAVAEWLGRGLQSLVQRFDSARRLFSVYEADAVCPAVVGKASMSALRRATR